MIYRTPAFNANIKMYSRENSGYRLQAKRVKQN